MAKITDPDDLNVGTELTLDTSAKTFTLNVAGNITSAKEGVTLQALYSKFVDLWLTSTYNKFPFPMYVIDSLSGQYIFGFDGNTYNGWKPSNDATRQMLRDGGWSEYLASGAIARQYVGIISLGVVTNGSQLYYQLASTDASSNFVFTDAVNEGVQVYGDADNGNFDKRTFFKGFVREEGKKYKSSVLSDTGKNGTGGFIVNLLLNNENDPKIQDTDIDIEGSASATYDPIVVMYYDSNQTRSIGGENYPFRIIISGASATAEQIYTKIQYLLRQNSDIDSNTGLVTGKTASDLLSFVGDTLYTSQGVYIDDYDNNDINRLVFTNYTGTQVSEPYTAAGNLSFNSVLTGGSGYYRMYFNDFTGGSVSFNYGQSSAVTVNDADGNPIAGSITSSTIAFSYSYDTNTQSGRTAEADVGVTVVAGNAGSAKPVVTTHTITRSVGQNISLVAEQDRAYLE